MAGTAALHEADDVVSAHGVIQITQAAAWAQAELLVPANNVYVYRVVVDWSAVSTVASNNTTLYKMRSSR